MKRIVMLDIDGVINSYAYDSSRGEITPGDIVHRFAQAIDPRAVRRLNEIVARSGAVVVVSSSWREHFSLDQLRQLLARRGFRGMVVGKTPVFDESRGREIAWWLHRYGPVESFVILDDRTDMDELQSRLVKTDYADGLQDRHVAQALSMLVTPWVGASASP